MSTTKDVAGIVPGLMGIALVGESMKMIPENMTGFKKGKSTKMKTKPFAMKPINYKNQNKKMIKGFTNIAVGTSLIGATAGMINKL